MLKKSVIDVPCLRRSASRRQVVALRGSTYQGVRRASSFAAAAPVERRILDFGELPSTGSGPELVEDSRATRRDGACENQGLLNIRFEHPNSIRVLTPYRHVHLYSWYQPGFPAAYSVRQTH